MCFSGGEYASEGIREHSTVTRANTRSHLAYSHRCSANFFEAVKGAKGRFVQRSASSLSVGSASTNLGTGDLALEVPEVVRFQLAVSPTYYRSRGHRGNGSLSKRTVERVGGECWSIFLARGEQFRRKKCSRQA